MKNKTLVIYILEIAALIFFTIYSYTNVSNKTISKDKEYVDNYNEGWYRIVNGKRVNVSQGETLDVAAGEKLVLYNKLPRKSVDCLTLGFFTGHTYVEVYSDDEIIYSFGLEDNSSAKSPGCKWNLVNISYVNKNDNIRVELCSNYESNSGFVPSFYIGSKQLIKEYIIRSKLPNIFFSFTIFVIGIGMLIVYFLLNKKYRIKGNLVYAGLIAVGLSLWMMNDSNIPALILGYDYLFSMLAFILLTIPLYPFIEYVRRTYIISKIENIIFSVLEIVMCTALLAIIALHLLEVREMKETYLVIHIIMFIILAFNAIIICRNIVNKYIIEKKNRWWLSILLIVIVIPIAYDLYIYNFGFTLSTTAASSPTEFSLLLLILILGCDSFGDTAKLANDGKMIENYKDIAFHDPLTKLRNRAAFDDKMKKITENSYENYGIIMLDLNNLKYFNDVFGHEMGDMYIITCSKIVSERFADKGQPYRIGGDEFCIIVPKLRISEYDSIRLEIEQRVELMNCAIYEKKMGISIGYAEFKKEYDLDLYSTMNRADKLMYDYKQKHKR